jgi:hypothetical protein
LSPRGRTTPAAARGASRAGEVTSIPEVLALLDSGLQQVWAADQVMAELSELADSGVEMPEEVASLVRRWARCSEPVRVGLLAAEAAHGVLEEQFAASPVSRCA